jgi:hypothetical protein
VEVGAAEQDLTEVKGHKRVRRRMAWRLRLELASSVDRCEFAYRMIAALGRWGYRRKCSFSVNIGRDRQARTAPA